MTLKATAKAALQGLRNPHQPSRKSMRTMERFAQFLPPDRSLRELGLYSSGLARNLRPSYLRLSWRSLFFYLCTDNISFAPLKSQGADLRLDYIKNASGTPPPCSPKSIYALARFVSLFTNGFYSLKYDSYHHQTNIQPLRELSFRDIESKLSEDNIVEELSSHVSST